MFNIQTLNAISKKGLAVLPEAEFAIANEVENPDAIIVRSADMHSFEMGANLKAIARAGAGTNNIPVVDCAEKGIVVFNSPGANANAVKELVLTGILLSSRKVMEGINWSQSLKGQENVSKLVEKGKKNYAGPEIKGKRLGVVGLGAIGVLVANAGIALGMEVVGYDPFLSVSAALNISSHVELCENLEKMVAKCDYISLHVPFNKNTENLFNDEMFSQMKKGARLLNFARGGLVETAALKKALDEGILYKYITDFPNDEVLNMENVIAIPHLGASTPESEENCATMAAMELKAFLKYGIIKNSVNYPDCESIYTGKVRITIAHKNVPNMVGSITGLFANKHLNIDNMVNRSKGDFAYTIIDLDNVADKSIIQELEKIEGVIRARLVREK